MGRVDALALLLIAGTLLAQIGDVVTTQVGLRQAGIQELNPLMASLIGHDPTAAYLVKILVVSAGILLLLWRYPNPRALRLGLATVFLVSSIGFIHNMPLLVGS